MHPRYVRQPPAKVLQEMPRLPGAPSARRIRVCITVYGTKVEIDDWWYFADTDDDAIRYKQEVTEQYGRGNVRVRIIVDNNTYFDQAENRLGRYHSIGENAVNGKKKASSVAGSPT